MNPPDHLAVWNWGYLVLKASLLSTSGAGNIPSLHADLVPPGHATDAQFAEAFAVGQVTPGPGGLWVVSLGCLLLGMPGALVALAALLPPPLLVLFVGRAHARVQNSIFVRGFLVGLGAAIAGVSLVTLSRLLTSVGITPVSISIALVALALAASRRVPILVIFALAALAGIATRQG